MAIRPTPGCMSWEHDSSTDLLEKRADITIENNRGDVEMALDAVLCVTPLKSKSNQLVAFTDKFILLDYYLTVVKDLHWHAWLRSLEPPIKNLVIKDLLSLDTSKKKKKKKGKYDWSKKLTSPRVWMLRKLRWNFTFNTRPVRTGVIRVRIH